MRRHRFEPVVHLHELPLLMGLVVTWMALWREVSLLSLLSGLLVSVIAMRLFYLPPVEVAGRLNLWWAFRYLVYFIWHLAAASFQVAWLAIRPGSPPKTSIIAVRLRTRSDFLLTMVALTVSLIPGSVVAEVDRFRSTLYLHVLNTPTQKEIRGARSAARRIEEMLIRAVGSREEVEALR
ncbi:Na+/H+ antiporter subunit E [Leucobacter weissii]|uniref:Na+/H+ antiporter subunit E n=1 Tax=Leucobacter weissii TaxID=1983706 RepID=A0A939MJS2_9MICO|nr:Na+/H+ antiporter subunit E [Leucobacter weissii]MBO1902033.1 Na+/H+ antiporter subunit E [Leucobacter weissii]